jgi:integrase
VRSYDRALKLRVLPALGHLKLGKIARKDVQALVNAMYAGTWKAPDGKPSKKPLGSSTVANTLDPLRVIFRQAIEADTLSVNPTHALRLRKTKKRIPRIAEPEHMRALLAALPEIEDRALWMVAFHAGLRRGEIKALRWIDLDLEAGEIHVERGWDDEEDALDPKSEAGRRIVPITAELRDTLLKLEIRTGRRGDVRPVCRSLRRWTRHQAGDPFAPAAPRAYPAGRLA